MPFEPADYAPTMERFSGFAGHYDSYRPGPPTVLAEILAGVTSIDIPDLVVDLGSGTGLSTRYWASRARKVIGIEPTADMRRQAERRAIANVSYQEGFSHRTGLPDRCADVVTCAQALHWMDPQATFAEVARILRPGGVFAAYDYDWPPTVSHWEVDAAYDALEERVAILERERHVSDGLQRWSKDEHLARIRASGQFRFSKEVVVHHTEPGNADRLIGLALSQGSVMSVLKQGLGEAEIGLDAFRTLARELLGDQPKPWFFSCRIRLAVL